MGALLVLSSWNSAVSLMLDIILPLPDFLIVDRLMLKIHWDPAYFMHVKGP